MFLRSCRRAGAMQASLSTEACSLSIKIWPALFRLSSISQSSVVNFFPPTHCAAVQGCHRTAADAAPAADRAAFFAAATAIIAAAMSSCADSSVRTKRAFTSSHAAALL